MCAGYIKYVCVKICKADNLNMIDMNPFKAIKDVGYLVRNTMNAFISIVDFKGEKFYHRKVFASDQFRPTPQHEDFVGMLKTPVL